MTIAEWINEAPGRMIIIKAPNLLGSPGVSIHARQRALGRPVVCDIEVCESLLADVDAASHHIVDHITKATERLIYSIKDRN